MRRATDPNHDLLKGKFPQIGILDRIHFRIGSPVSVHARLRGWSPYSSICLAAS
jgi:hypothetical protein